MTTPCNTNTKAGREALPGIAAIDHLTINLKCHWGNWPRLHRTLQEAKQRATLQGNDPDLDRLTLGEWNCRIDRKGQRWGGGNAISHLPYVVMLPKGTRICIRDCSRPGGRVPDVQIIIGGTACLLHGAEPCRLDALHLLESIGAIVVEETLSRLDVCVDLIDADMNAVEAAWLDRALKYRNAGPWCEQTTVGFGGDSSPKRIRIYDKRKQLKQKSNPAVHAAMIARRWHGQEPDSAIRLEFQLRTEALKSLGVGAFADFEAKRGDVMVALTRPLKVHKPHTEAMVVIERAVHALQRWAGEPTDLPLKPIKPKAADTRTLARRGCGYFARIAAIRGYTFSSDAEVYAFFNKVLMETLPGYPFRRKVEDCKPDLGMDDPNKDLAA